jgi:hypothetical protein
LGCDWVEIPRLIMKDKVLEILKNTPVNVLEEDGESYLEIHKWELSEKREDGSTLIGSFNFMLAAKIIADSLETTIDDTVVLDEMHLYCSSLVEEGVLRETPSYRRSQLKLV